MVLNEWAWENRAQWEVVSAWLDNFDGRSGLSVEEERLCALYILSQFLYFGSLEIRVLLRALFRDLVLLPTIQSSRAALGGSRDANLILGEVSLRIDRTRFLGVGNPSESGVHLLYYFRQENSLRKTHFLDSAQIFMTDGGGQRVLRYPDVDRYIFVDDVCGSGETAVRYSQWLGELKALKPSVELHYLALFATEVGLDRVRRSSIFEHNSAAVFELDGSYKSMSARSRYLRVVPTDISPANVQLVANTYGMLVCPSDPLGYEDSQLLLGFHHNTPDNTLPIIWRDRENGSPITWRAAFRRYPKL
ncbi:phosphoribosyltransferase-like protein [Rhodopseudomonas palustris]|uniref:phosphoribosyltransferase-like protein n=1 Tax=Rhodopseudomonas palustris TaxID=1076 RepID=UPI00269B49A5